MPLPIALDYRPALLSRAGIGRATRELARALAARDDLQVHLFGHSLARARVATSVPPGAHLHRWPIAGRALPWLRRLGLPAERLAGNARVFHWTDYVQPPIQNARPVLTVHDLAFLREPSWHGENAGVLQQRTVAAIAAAAAIVVPSQATAQDLRAFVPTARAPQVIPFGADHVPTTVGANPLEGRPYVLCVGTIEPRKNHRALLRAFAQLPEPRPLLVVVGAIGWACDDIVQDLEHAVRDGAVRWLQSAADEELWALLQHARLLVYPSLWEGFGFPPLEAMALGVPVVANDTAALRELGGEAINLLDATNVDALADAIAQTVGDESTRRRLITEGRQRAQALRWRDCASAHAQLYREVSA